ncbi:MAG: hypothetical protein HZA24_10380 [Nitrospirae bacterium]|nr:hypothetical protein [Nitrospirota bacterium]
MSEKLDFFATCAKGVEPLLAAELRALGLDAVRDTRGGATFAGPVAAGYRACLWSRLASRVLLPVARFHCPSPLDLYEGMRSVKWWEHLDTDGTLAVDFSASNSAITHAHFGALKAKDAIVDQFRDRLGRRPSVDTALPDLRVNVYLERDQATVSLDLSGEALHRRGYRVQGGKAPLKENLAAAILHSARWPAMAVDGAQLVDPMCGAGTLLVEGALMAADVAPGLGRERFGFSRWLGHDGQAWGALVAEARERQAAGVAGLAPDRIHGYDRDMRSVNALNENLYHAGLEDKVRVTRRAVEDTEPQPGPPGLVVVNPPYGERLGADDDLAALYAALGTALKVNFPGWRAAVFTGNPDLAHHLRLAADRKVTLYNGPIVCRLLHYGIG